MEIERNMSKGEGGEVEGDFEPQQQGQGEDGEAPKRVPLAPPRQLSPTKLCAYCGLPKPISEFKRRTGKRRGATARRGACKGCRDSRKEQALTADAADSDNPAETLIATPVEVLPDAAGKAEEVTCKKKRRRRKKKKKAANPLEPGKAAAPAEGGHRIDAKSPPVKKPVPIRELKAIGLFPNRNGFIRMRGKTDIGRRWHQEIEPDLALTLVKERAAVVVSRSLIRRLYSNKEFRLLILERDNYTCRFCGQYGDTIDHMLPRAKGGHTTPDNCVCACMLCNQSKADRDMEEFLTSRV